MNLNQNELYKISQNYCKDFKYNICLCNRYFYKNCLANDNNNNFSFVNPVKFNYNDEKIFPIDIFTINDEFIKYKNKNQK
jgi:hypothetical protein